MEFYKRADVRLRGHEGVAARTAIRNSMRIRVRKTHARSITAGAKLKLCGRNAACVPKRLCLWGPTAATDDAFLTTGVSPLVSGGKRFPQ